MLPLLGVLVFAIMGIAALSVDAGLAFASQARLAAAAPTLAMERARFVEEEAAAIADGRALASTWDERANALLTTLLGQAALESDGSAGLRLETVTPNVQSTGGGTEAVLRGHTPLLFGMAALLPTRLGADGTRSGALSVSELNARRARGDLTPQLDSGGLRSTGFAPEGSAVVEDALIVRVGAPYPGIPGLAPVALFQQPELAVGGLLLTIDDTGVLLDEEDAVVGCGIDPQRGASVGPINSLELLVVEQLPDLELAYAPVLDRDSCDAGAGANIVGFLPVALFAPDVVQVRNPDSVQRPLVNASTVPGSGVANVPLLPDGLRGPRLVLEPRGGSG